MTLKEFLIVEIKLTQDGRSVSNRVTHQEPGCGITYAQDDRSVRMRKRLIVLLLTAAFSIAAAVVRGRPALAQDASAPHQGATDENEGLIIEPTELPSTYPHGPYQVIFHGRGNYVPTLHWSVKSGKLPPGITLEEDGVLHGKAERAGEFQFVIMVRDSGKPEQAVQREFTLKVVEAMTVAWKDAAHVNSNRIEGSVEVSNTTPQDMDLTFDVKAVADNGRATEIGYQHFWLKRGTLATALPFGDTLPKGAYKVYVTVVGEVPPLNAIYRQLLQTPKALHVNVGP